MRKSALRDIVNWQTKKQSNCTKFQALAWTIINSRKRNLNQWENCRKYARKFSHQTWLVQSPNGLKHVTDAWLVRLGWFTTSRRKSCKQSKNCPMYVLKEKGEGGGGGTCDAGVARFDRRQWLGRLVSEDEACEKMIQGVVCAGLSKRSMVARSLQFWRRIPSDGGRQQHWMPSRKTSCTRLGQAAQ